MDLAGGGELVASLELTGFSEDVHSRPIIASEAKQSRAPTTPLDCFASLAMTVDKKGQLFE
jgi:hypothetical protein